MMPNQERVLHGLDSCGFHDGIPNICEVTECPYRDDKCWCVHELAHDAGLLISELLKAQEPEAMDAPKPDSDIGCWYDITHNYTLEQVVSALKAQEPPTSEFISSAIECLLHPQDADDSDMAKAIDTAVRAMRLLKAQEPKLVKHTTSTIRCPRCNKQITSRGSIHNEIKYCWKCGQAVKWE